MSGSLNAKHSLKRFRRARSQRAFKRPRTRTKYAYDTANRMVSALIGSGSPQYVYGYDHASNLTSITPNGATQSFSYTSTNAITAGTYDANGSPTSLAGNSYKWDGANRVVHFASSAANTASSFTYDGLGRLVRVVDTHGGAITADHSYTWCGNIRCLAHDNTQSGSPVSTQYFDQGVIISGTAYYYVRDRLGSVTELVSSTGTIASQYTYDPYGTQTVTSGTASDIGYAGYFNHAVSGLDFTLHRAYDPTHARWINRDPIGEMGGINLYAYSDGNPISESDPSGNCPWCIGAVIGAFSGGAAGYISGGWQGAVAGAIVGGAVGSVAPWLSEEAGAAAGEGAAALFAAGGTNLTLGAAGGALSTVAGNELADKDPTDGLVFGTTLGALAPLASGEAFIVAAGGDAAVGSTMANTFSSLTSILSILGAAMDPNADHGFAHHPAAKQVGCRKGCPCR